LTDYHRRKSLEMIEREQRELESATLIEKEESNKY